MKFFIVKESIKSIIVSFSDLKNKKEAEKRDDGGDVFY